MRGCEITIMRFTTILVPPYPRTSVLPTYMPHPSEAEALVAILHVVGLHVDGGILAAGAVDMLAIGASLSIEL